MLDNMGPRYKRKVHCKVKMDKLGRPLFVAQEMYINTATKDDIEAVVFKHLGARTLAHDNLINELKGYFKQVSTQLRFTGHPKSFFEQSSGGGFFEELKFHLKKFSKGTIEIETKEGEEKKGPISIFSLFQYRD